MLFFAWMFHRLLSLPTMIFLHTIPWFLLLGLLAYVASLTVWGDFIYLVVLCAAVFIIGALLETWLVVTGRLHGFGR